jgi:hypothetical protein
MEQLEQSKPQFSTNQVFGILKTCEDEGRSWRCSLSATCCAQIKHTIEIWQFLLKH